MKTTNALIFSFFFLLTNAFGQQVNREIVLMGTMHTVPKIVKHSYKPMFKKALKYNPDAIYVESPMANDSLSWSYLKKGWSKNYQKFYKLSDSLQQTASFDQKKFESLSKIPLKELTTGQLEELISFFASLRDNGNYEYYSYLKKYGINGAKKPTRHEDGDLTYKLALRLNHKQVYNMDDQRTNKEYHEGWSKCVKEGVRNGNNEILNKLNKKDYNAAMIPAIFGKLGKHTNKRKSLERLHRQSSFSYVKQDTDGCKQGRRFWNERNARMATNIGNQVLKNGHQKSLVIVGAAHIIGLEKELKEQFPVLKIRLAYE
ncbi:MAG: hypothetical protein CMB99_15060 [Flavobacteriaceae bacterium]|nr:hypothetical protein [Flavobacteriaceae bacterium]|tara:strand:+ start:319629 stop:320576 length:948 start_codon:yes stop_codon:yes gene_type:complete